VAAAVTVTLVLVGLITLSSYTENINEGLSDNLIRLHVIANSDSPEDQALKRDVRDVVLAYVKEELTDSKNISNAKTILQSQLNDIASIAKTEILRHGKDYDAKAYLGSYPFPTKSYGDIKLPAGEYQALRLVIGEGRGANWWCVLFPPLCFVDVTHGTVPDSVKDDLREVLTDEEYHIVSEADDQEDIPIKVKFKIIELFQDSKIKLADTLGHIFKSRG
jgi:stage II sporulation protein R